MIDFMITRSFINPQPFFNVCLFSGRVKLRQDFPGDAALVITGLQLCDIGRYRCEVADGQEDGSVTVNLELNGAVRLYSCLRIGCQIGETGC